MNSSGGVIFPGSYRSACSNENSVFRRKGCRACSKNGWKLKVLAALFNLVIPRQQVICGACLSIWCAHLGAITAPKRPNSANNKVNQADRGKIGIRNIHQGQSEPSALSERLQFRSSLNVAFVLKVLAVMHKFKAINIQGIRREISERQITTSFRIKGVTLETIF